MQDRSTTTALDEVEGAGPSGVRYIGLRSGVAAYEMAFTTEPLAGVIIGDKADPRGPLMFLDPSTRYKRRSLIRLLVESYMTSADRIVVSKAFQAEAVTA